MDVVEYSYSRLISTLQINVFCEGRTHDNTRLSAAFTSSAGS